jgi:sarcosine oxidase, subunit gamma
MQVTLQTLETRCWGVKGPQAAQWLEHHDVQAPIAANSWSALERGAGIILRLGAHEFFLEEPAAARPSYCGVLAEELQIHTPGVYPMPREDRAMQLSGAGAHAALSEAGSYDFAGLALAAQPVLMTSLLGVAVILIAQPAAAGCIYRIWCDPSHGGSLQAGLQAIAADLQ